MSRVALVWPLVIASASALRWLPVDLDGVPHNVSVSRCRAGWWLGGGGRGELFAHLRLACGLLQETAPTWSNGSHWFLYPQTAATTGTLPPSSRFPGAGYCRCAHGLSYRCGGAGDPVLPMMPPPPPLPPPGVVSRFAIAPPTHLLALPLSSLPIGGGSAPQPASKQSLRASPVRLPMANVPGEALWPGATLYVPRRRMVVSFSGYMASNSSPSIGGVACGDVFAGAASCLLPTYRTHLLRLDDPNLAWRSLLANETGPGTPNEVRNGTLVGLPFMYASGLQLLYDDASWNASTGAGDVVWAVGGFLSPVGAALEQAALYQFDLATLRWRFIPTSGAAPDNSGLGLAVSLGSAVLDAARRQVVVFGGSAWNRVVTSGTCYTLSLVTFAWQAALSCSYLAGPPLTFGAATVPLPVSRRILLLAGGETDYTEAPDAVSARSRACACAVCDPTPTGGCMGSRQGSPTVAPMWLTTFWSQRYRLPQLNTRCPDDPSVPNAASNGSQRPPGALAAGIPPLPDTHTHASYPSPTHLNSATGDRLVRRIRR
jgi:hypothetical protein